MSKAKLSFWQVVNMNFGFLGLQYSFGLQQANMSPIYSYLGAEEKNLPYLWLAGPITGLILQPIVGAMSDRTHTRWGRRTPYFLAGAICCSLCLLAMPFSSAVWMAAGVLWILDAGNNITQEPYRAFVSDKLAKEQHALGFLTQSAFTGLGQTLSYLTPTILIGLGVSQYAANSHNIPITTMIAFMMGAAISLGSILWTLKTTKEDPPELTDWDDDGHKKNRIANVFVDIYSAIKTMPRAMKQLIPMMLLSWYAMFIYWIYIAKCLSRTVYDPNSPSAFRQADILAGQLGAYYNFIAFLSAFFLVKLSNRWTPQLVHCCCLALAGIGLLTLPYAHSPWMAFLPITGMGLCWASLMGNPYVIVAGSIPPQRAGIYLGLFNMFIVVPMLLQNLTMPLYYEELLGNNPVRAVTLAGVLLLVGGAATLLVKVQDNKKAASIS